MLKKIMATAALLCAAPTFAHAGWYLSTQARNVGGTITSPNGIQTVVNNVKTKSFSVLTPQTISVAANTGYTLKSLTVTDTSIDPSTRRTVKVVTDATASASNYTLTPADNHSYMVAAIFSAQGVSITASNPGGSVSPSRMSLVYGTTLARDLRFSFVPAKGYAITDITGVPAGASTSVSGIVNQAAYVVIPAGTRLTAPISLAAVVSNHNVGLNTILPQIKNAGKTVAINATLTGVASPSCTWSYFSGPANVTTSNGAALGFTPGPAVEMTPSGTGNCSISFTAPSVTGQYVFKVTDSVSNTTQFAAVKVVAAATDAGKNQCQFCHTANGVGTTVFSSWSGSAHGTTANATCSDCHVGTNSGSHPGEVSTFNTCNTCHNNDATGFAASRHWNNHFEFGPEFANQVQTTVNGGQVTTGDYVSGVLNPNDGYYTTEFGETVTCAYRCHFRPGMGPGSEVGTVLSKGKSTGYITYTDSLNGKTYSRPGGNACVACHDPHGLKASYQTCLTCHTGSKHGKVPTEFFASKHWNNDFEYGSEFLNQAQSTVSGGNVKLGDKVDGILNANDSYNTTENGGVVTCAYRCHFRPGMGPQQNVAGQLVNGKAINNVKYTDALNSVDYVRPGGDACLACHDPHKLNSDYQTCLSCHSGSKHGKVPTEFFGSKHWKNSSEFGPEFGSQIQATVQGGDVKLGSSVDGVLEPNDSYTTTENGAVVTCAYRCHFRPGMGPQKDVTGYLADGKSTTYVMYSSPYGAGKFTRPGGNACMACHDPHGLETNARSTCYTCHAGGNHGWSVKAFEKSTHFTGGYAIADGIGGPTGEACTACHNPHSTEAAFFTMSTATQVKGATGCQKCHAPGATYAVYNGNGTGKAPHFQTNTANVDGYYPTASYITDNPAYSNSCADCHSHNNTINAGWAAGGHGKVDVIPWTTSKDDDWNRGTAGVNYQVSAQKTDCQRCHTAKGFAQFWDSGFTNIEPLGGKSSAPLVCSGCHSNVDKGTLRPLPTEFATGVKTYVGYSTIAYSTKKSVTAMTFPDMKNSNVCIPCHAGRGTGALIKEVYKTPSATAYLIGTRIYSHFASAAGVVNGSSAYEFTAPKANTHSLIGTNALYGTGKATQGPCVGCHMTSSDTTANMTHSLETLDVAGGKFKTDVCKNCHGTNFTVADVAEQKAQFNAALNVLRNLLLQRGIDKLQSEINSRPGERQGQDMRGNAASLALITSLGLDQMLVAERNTGAAFNWWHFGTSSTGVAQGDVAAYVHNPGYARQVIMDSIDWMDDYQMNGSAKATIQAMVGQPQPTYNDGTSTDGVVIDQTAADRAAAFAVPATNNHFAPAASTYKSQYVAGSSICATCHNPQESTIQKEAREAWAESGHGEVAALPWVPSSSHLWSTTGSAADFTTTIPANDCVRCHTADGFKQFATGTKPFSNVKALAGDGKTNSPLNCQGCHISPLNDTSDRLAVPAVATFFNVSTVDKVSGKTVKSRIAANFPDVEASNMCISCHAGRVSGPNLTELATTSTNWSLENAGFQNSHYMAAAGVMYMKSGFINFTTLTAPTPSSKDGEALKLSTKPYAKTLLPDATSTPDGISGGQTSIHRLIGTEGIKEEGAPGGDALYLANGDVIAKGGPCVNCHIQADNPQKGNAAASANPLGIDLYAGDAPAKRPGAGHSLTALDDTTIKQICLPCHAHTKGLTLENFLAVKVNPAKNPYQDTLELIKKLLLAKYNIKYDSASYPYFYDLQKDPAGKTAVTDWTRKGVAGIPAQGLSKMEAYRLQGACFNLNLLSRDPGAYIHGRTYSQRLQYDTIDFLDDRTMNFSALDTARTVFPEKFFGMNANTGYNVDLATYPVASEGILWLSGTHPNNNEIEPPDTTSVLRIKLRP